MREVQIFLVSKNSSLNLSLLLYKTNCHKMIEKHWTAILKYYQVNNHRILGITSQELICLLYKNFYSSYKSVSFWSVDKAEISMQ